MLLSSLVETDKLSTYASMLGYRERRLRDPNVSLTSTQSRIWEHAEGGYIT